MFGVESGSANPLLIISALFVILVQVGETSVDIVNVAEPPFNKVVFKSQIPVPTLYVPVLGVATIFISPAGTISLTCTPKTSKGPLFVTVIVNVIVSPIFGFELSTDFC